MLLILDPRRFNDSLHLFPHQMPNSATSDGSGRAKKLAMDFQVPHSQGLEPALLQKSIHQRLKAFRQDAPYIAFLLSPIFAAIAMLVVLFVWVSNGMPPS
jgi:hypothetical protein